MAMRTRVYRQTVPVRRAVRAPVSGGPPITLLGRINEILRSRMTKIGEDGKPVDGTVMDSAAQGFVNMMIGGNFAHLKEYLDRENGKVPTRVADAEGKSMKMYVGVPTDEV